MNNKFLKWWLLFVLQSITVGIIAYFGGVQFLYENDKTMLSFFIAFIWLSSNLTIGYNIYYNKETTEFQWFSADSCMTIGMVGTVVGFIFMLSGTLGDIDPGDIAQTKQVISRMAMGMSTALLTTLTGLIASLYIKIQLVLYEGR